MTTIRFKLKNLNEKKFAIEAQTIPGGGTQPNHGAGNLDVEGGTKITWDAKETGGNVEATEFTAEFRNLQNNDLAWPFIEKADGTGVAPPGYVGPLVLSYDAATKQYSSVSLTTKPLGFAVKYTVTAKPTQAIEALDPMIIIRPQSLAAVNVAFGVSCAVLGAVAGALLTAWLL